MFKSTIKFIHDLRIFFFALILVSSLYSLGLNPVDIGKFIGAKAGKAVGVSMSTSVPPNPFNTLAMQLEQKERLLDEREQMLAQQEAGPVSQRGLIYLLLSGIVVLSVLIILNFYLDYRRRNEKK
jgi:hypothetical protein